MKRQVPDMRTDEEAEAFLASDLSDLDFGQFTATRFRFDDKPDKQRKRKSSVRSGSGSTTAIDPIIAKSDK